MIIPDDIQIALLLVLYLCRSGKADLYDISKELKVNIYDLFHAAEYLRSGGILDSADDVEFQLVADPTIEQVFKAFGWTGVISVSQSTLNLTSGVEGRALNYIAEAVAFDALSLLKLSVRHMGQSLVTYELSLLDKPSSSTSIN